MSVTDQPQLDRTSRDKDAIIEDFVGSGGTLETTYGADAADFVQTELGYAMIELIAAVGDSYNFACDRVGNEGFLPTLRETQSVLDHAKGLTYTPKGSIPSRYQLNLTTDFTDQLVLEEKRVVLTNPSVGARFPFEFEAEVVKPSGVTTFTAIVVAGRSVTHPPFVSQGTGTTRTRLLQSGVIDDSIVVVVGGVTWTAVSTFAESGPADLHYRVTFEEKTPGERFALIDYGDGINGAFPALGELIQISYRTGGGTDTNVPAGTIDRFEIPVTDSLGQIINITVSNDDPALQLGQDPETRDQIRVNAPIFARTNERLVSNTDYQDGAIEQGALRALAVTNNESSMIQENTVLVFIATSVTASTPKSDAESIKTSMLAKWPGRDTRRFLTAPVQTLSFKYELTVTYRSTANIATVQSEVESALTSFFAADSLIGDPQRFVLDIGRRVFRSNVSRVIDTLRSVASVDFTKLTTTDHTAVDVVSTTEFDVEPDVFQLPITSISDWTITYTKES